MTRTEIAAHISVDRIFSALVEASTLPYIIGLRHQEDEATFKVLSSDLVGSIPHFHKVRSSALHMPSVETSGYKRHIFYWQESEQKTLIVGFQVCDPMSRSIVWATYSSSGEYFWGEMTVAMLPQQDPDYPVSIISMNGNRRQSWRSKSFEK